MKIFSYVGYKGFNDNLFITILLFRRWAFFKFEIDIKNGKIKEQQFGKVMFSLLDKNDYDFSVSQEEIDKDLHLDKLNENLSNKTFLEE